VARLDRDPEHRVPRPEVDLDRGIERGELAQPREL